jgi:hypothetical protein
MKKDIIILEQERDFGDKINASFTFVSQNFKTLFLSVLYFAGPLSLIGGIANGIVQSNNLAFISAGATKPRGTNPGEIFANSFGDSFAHLLTLNYLIAVIFLILASVTVAITVYAIMLEYKENPESLTIGRVWARMQTIFLPVLGSYFVTILIFMLIIIAFVAIIAALISGVGGIFAGFLSGIIGIVGFVVAFYFFVMYSLSPAIVAYEGIGALEALGRAKFLIKDKWWSTFGLIIIISIINSFVAMIFGAPAMIITFMKVLKVGGGISGNVPLILTTMISTVGQVIVSSLTYIAISFQYFNLVEKREGNGLKMLIEGIGQKKLDLNEDGEY